MSNFTSTMPIDVVFGIVSLSAAIPGILGNVWILKLFYSEKQLLSRKIFILIAITDVTTSLWSAIPFGASRLMGRQPVLFDNKAFCNLSGLIYNITSRLSVFLISVLSFTRCIAIISPMQHLRHNLVMGSILGYSIIQLITASIPFIHFVLADFTESLEQSELSLYSFNEHYTNCVWTVDQVIPDAKKVLYEVAEYLLLFIPFFFPSVIVLTSCGVCVYSLVRSVSNFPVSHRDSDFAGDKANGVRCSVDLQPDQLETGRRARNSILSTKYRATRTITLVTLLFVILNIPHWVLLLLFFIEQNTGLQIINYRNEYVRCLFVFATNVSPYLNAGLNPIIYLVRVREIKYSLNLNAYWIRLDNLRARSVSRLRDLVFTSATL